MTKVLRYLLSSLLVAIMMITDTASVASTSKETPSEARCSADLEARTNTLKFPAPVRLDHSFDLFGFRFEPVPSHFQPRASPNLAWTGFANEWETHAIYHVYLAHFVDLAAQLAHLNGLPSQDVWVAVIRHDAYATASQSLPPGVKNTQPSCVFGTAINVVNALTGRQVVSGS